jgi:ATP-dependent helicase/nuclease subunit A
VNTPRDRVRGEAENEYRRLLYVGMTRAMDQLIVCGYDGERKRPQGCWYDLVFDALSAIAVVSEPTNGAEGPIWRFGGDTPGPIGATGPTAATPAEALRPAWLDRDAGPAERRLVPLSPSSALREATTVRTGGQSPKALARGRTTPAPNLARYSREAGHGAASATSARVPSSTPRNARPREQVLAILIMSASPTVPVGWPRCRRTAHIAGRPSRCRARSSRRHRGCGLIADYKTNRPAPER